MFDKMSAALKMLLHNVGPIVPIIYILQNTYWEGDSGVTYSILAYTYARTLVTTAETTVYELKCQTQITTTFTKFLPLDAAIAFEW